MIKTKLSKRAVFAFFVSLLLCSLLIIITIKNRANIDRLQMEQQILEKTIRVNDAISRLLYKTNSLATMVIQGQGSINNFNLIAPTIVDDPSIVNILIAPNGIVSNVYPPEASAIMGWDFFGEGVPGSAEAKNARDTGRLILSGPYTNAEGRLVLAGRLPIFVDTDTEKQAFWGIVSISLKFPEVLDGAEINLLETRGFAYELWRTNPDTDERQIIASCHYDKEKLNTRYIEKHLPVLNADWYLKVWPLKMWYNHAENIALIVAGALISFLVFFIVQNNIDLIKMKVILEDMAMLDSLTNIFNRRHFMNLSKLMLEKARRQGKKDNYIIIFDIDKFKSVNDTYGHLIGDNVLIELAARIKALIRPYDIFARYGGEEFIIYASEIDIEDLIEMGERLRLSIFDKNFEYENLSLNISASFGVAIIDNYDIDKAILHSDRALYIAKKNGRNQVVFYDENNIITNES